MTLLVGPPPNEEERLGRKEEEKEEKRKPLLHVPHHFVVTHTLWTAISDKQLPIGMTIHFCLAKRKCGGRFGAHVLSPTDQRDKLASTLTDVPFMECGKA